MPYAPSTLKCLIRSTLWMMEMHSEAAEELLLGTAAHESHLGTYTQQLGHGPALGIYQMEPATLYDIFDNYLIFRPDKLQMVEDITSVDQPDLLKLRHDPIYGTVMARLHYWRVPVELPVAGDLLGQAWYWDTYFNCNPDKGTPEQYQADYKRLVLQRGVVV